MGVAQFRRATARRRSLCSNSESDFDRISRTSMDSFLEDNRWQDNTDAASTTECANDLVAVDSPKKDLEERTSTGGEGGTRPTNSCMS